MPSDIFWIIFYDLTPFYDLLNLSCRDHAIGA
jgi:hypothetical protein